MSEHTPSPWGFGNGREGERLILGDNGNGNYVAHVQIHQTPRAMGMLDEEEREANAKLIKAAPDMFEALKKSQNLARQFWVKAINDSGKHSNNTAIVWRREAERLERIIAKAETPVD